MTETVLSLPFAVDAVRGRENTAGTTHFLLPALLESVRISFSEALDFRRLLLGVTRVAKVWPLNVGHF